MAFDSFDKPKNDGDEYIDPLTPKLREWSEEQKYRATVESILKSPAVLAIKLDQKHNEHLKRLLNLYALDLAKYDYWVAAKRQQHVFRQIKDGIKKTKEGLESLTSAYDGLDYATRDYILITIKEALEIENLAAHRLLSDFLEKAGLLNKALGGVNPPQGTAGNRGHQRSVFLKNLCDLYKRVTGKNVYETPDGRGERRGRWDRDYIDFARSCIAPLETNLSDEAIERYIRNVKPSN